MLFEAGDNCGATGWPFLLVAPRCIHTTVGTLVIHRSHNNQPILSSRHIEPSHHRLCFSIPHRSGIYYVFFFFVLLF